MTSSGKRPDRASSTYFGKDGYWHGRVTVGIKDDGRPDRRHVMSKNEGEVISKVRELEKHRDAGKVRKPGKGWTVSTWLTHWVEEISAPSVAETTLSGYRVDVYHHLIPGLGAHRLEKLEPEHLERFYKKMQETGSKPATAHHVHRTIRAALNQAMRRDHVTRNVASLATPPKIDEEEVEPYEIEEVQRLLAEAVKHRNSARWAVALALGLRQGEALGLMWKDVDLEAGTLWVLKARRRPKYVHGCGGTCGKQAGYCKQRRQVNADTAKTKSRAGKRGIGVPDELVQLLVLHRAEQENEKTDAGAGWTDSGYVFTRPDGGPVIPKTDYGLWKQLLKRAEVRDGRLHDARHTAGTILLILGVPEWVVMEIMGWSSTAMAARYQHVTGRIRRDVAKQVGGLIWEVAKGHEEKPRKKKDRGKKKRKADRT